MLILSGQTQSALNKNVSKTELVKVLFQIKLWCFIPQKEKNGTVMMADDGWQ